MGVVSCCDACNDSSEAEPWAEIWGERAAVAVPSMKMGYSGTVDREMLSIDAGWLELASSLISGER